MSPRLTLILATTYTVADLHRRVALWRAILEEVVFTEEDIPDPDELTKTIVALCDERDAAVVSAWPAAVWHGVTSQNLATEAAQLVVAAKAQMATIIYVPVALAAADIAALGAWCRSECAIALLDIKVDPKVVGGCGVVGASATYHEYSLRTRLKEAPGTITALVSAYA